MEYHVKTFWFIQQYFDSLIEQHWKNKFDKSYEKDVAKERKKLEKLAPTFIEFIKFVYDNGGVLPNPPSSKRSPFMFINWDREKFADDIKYPFPVPKEKKTK